jgi:trehalose 6-phosphate phosphatase
VIGVDRTGHADELAAAGADVVVGDLGELENLGTATPAEGNDIRDLPLALDHGDELRRTVSERRPAVFLDYDGTLTPIVGRPEDAALPPRTRAAIERLAALVPVAILSGRDLQDVRRMVGIDGITYAGSHGFDLVRTDGSVHQRGREFLPDLDAAERGLGPRLEGIPGARVERKAFAIAVHFRQADDDRVPEIDAAVAEVAAEHPRLRRTGGKKIFELRPDLDWDKGKALDSLLEELGLGGDDVLPIYVGDDDTDEDAFRAIAGGGLGLVVRGERDARPTSARYALRDTEEARAFLELLGDAMSGDASA